MLLIVLFCVWSLSKGVFETELRDRVGIDEERKRMAAAIPRTDKELKLKVGDVRLETSSTALTKFPDSMLGRMFGRSDTMLQVDPDDYHFRSTQIALPSQEPTVNVVTNEVEILLQFLKLTS